MPDPHRWDSAKNEMEIITFGPGAKFDYKFVFRLFIAFGEIESLAAKMPSASWLRWAPLSSAS